MDNLVVDVETGEVICRNCCICASEIAIKILDESGNFIGMLKAVANIESVTESCQGTQS